MTEEFEYIDTNTIERHGKGNSKAAMRTRARRAAKFEKQKGLCYWCCKLMQLNHLTLTSKGYLKQNNGFATFEHLIPKNKVKGHKRGEGGVVLAHATCNRNRHRLKWAHDPIYGTKGLTDEI